jgi:hypothetical protein
MSMVHDRCVPDRSSWLMHSLYDTIHPCILRSIPDFYNYTLTVLVIYVKETNSRCLDFSAIYNPCTVLAKLFYLPSRIIKLERTVLLRIRPPTSTLKQEMEITEIILAKVSAVESQSWVSSYGFLWRTRHHSRIQKMFLKVVFHKTAFVKVNIGHNF